MTTEEAITWFERRKAGSTMAGATSMYNKAIAALRAQSEAERNELLTLDELLEMERAGLSIWCVDTDGTAQGLLCMRNDWDAPHKSPHVWLLDEEANAGVYSVKYMLDFGVKFYRHRPKEEPS